MNLLKKIFRLLSVFILVSFLSFEIEAKTKAKGKKDCVACVQEEVTGAPLGGNGSIENLAKVVTSEDDHDSLEEYIKKYCMSFTQIRNNYEFKKEMTISMSETPFSVDKYWQFSGCIPSKIGNTSSPIIHLVAERPSIRAQFIKSLYNYYNIERKSNELWLKAINAVNSNGQTLLDYVIYLNNSGKIISTEKKSTNELVGFLCDNGGEFAKSNLKCPLHIN